MAKIKAGLLSMGARGTIGEAVTFQERVGIQIARKKPIPAYRYTLSQAYQRWLYEDYCYLWGQQSIATKAEYRTAGVRFHLTGFQYWMKYHLKNLPDIELWARFDINTGGIAYDLSRHQNNGVIIGASPATGGINGALSFDGLNDVVRFPDQPYYSFGDGVTDRPFSMEALVNMVDATRFPIINKGVVTEYEWVWWTRPLDILTFQLFSHSDLGKRIGIRSTIALTSYEGQKIHVCATYDGSGLQAGLNQYLNGTLLGVVNDSMGVYIAMVDYTQPIRIGRLWDVGDWADGIIDNLIVYNRELDQPTIKRHAERRHQ